jgi:hypothetical protein
MGELAKAAKMVRNEALKDLEEKMKMLKPLLEINAKVKESDFKKYFLPLIKKEVPINEDNVNIFLHNVYMMTGSYSVPMEVWTDDLKEKLFTLPPIFMDIDDDSPLVSNISYGKLVNKYKRLSETNQKIGDEFLDVTMKKLSDLLKPTPEQEAYYIKEIAKMYKRYGILHDEANQNEKDLKKKNEIELMGDDMFDYD